MVAHMGQTENIRATEVAGLNNRLDAIGWALLLILTGLVWIAPRALVPEGAWLIGFGFILLGVNVARSLNAIPVQGFGIWLGILALALGGLDLAGAILGLAFDLPIFAISLIVLGVVLLARELAGNSGR